MSRGGRPARERKALDGPKAWEYALNLLSRQAYTEAEISERLARRQAAPEVIEDVLTRLRRFQLVDDEAYAEAFVRTRAPRRGALALRRELLRKGVPEEITEESLADLDEARQADAAAKLLVRNAWRFSSADGRRNRARAFAFLARRGFPSPVVMEVLERAEWLIADPAEED